MRRQISVKAGILVLFLIFFVISVCRAHYGIETTDEALSYSEAILINQGAVPYVEVWQQCAGSFQLYGWLISLFSLFSPNLEGLFLYMRLMFCLLRVLVVAAIYFLISPRLRETYEKNILLITLVPLIDMWWGSGNGFNYNSLPMIFMTLAATLVISESLKNATESPSYWKAYAAGILMALSAYSHATYIFCCAAFVVTIYAFSPDNTHRWSYTWRYISGGMTTATVLVLVLLIESGSVEHFAAGLRGFFANMPYFGLEKVSKVQQVKNAIQSTTTVLRWIAAGVVAAVVICRVFSSDKELGKKTCAKVLLTGAIIGLALYVGVNERSTLGYTESISFYYTHQSMVWSLFVVTGLLWLFGNKYGRLNKIFLILFIPEGILYCAQMFLIFSGPRPYLLAPVGVLLIPYTCVICRDVMKAKSGKVLAPAAAVALVCVAMLSINMYVYRDENLPLLNTKMNSTVYKGIYTTPEHEEALTQLHEYITQYTSEDDLIFCNEFNSCIFLLSDAKYCTFSTGGGCYEYGMVDDKIMMGYMELTGKVPTAVVYASTWVKPKLSIDDPEYELNVFFKENYDKVLDAEINEEIPRIVILRQKNEQ